MTSHVELKRHRTWQQGVECGVRVVSKLRQPLPVLWHKLTHPLIWPVNLGPPEQLTAQMVAQYNDPRQVEYDVQQVQEGLKEPEQVLIQGPMATRGRLLDVGCGVGREAIALAKLGHQVVGIDVAPRVIEAAERNAKHAGLDIVFLRLAAHEVPPMLGPFDYVLVTYNFYNIIPTRTLRLKTLRTLANVLKAGGKLFLSASSPVVYRPGVRAHLVDWLRRVRWVIPGNTGTAEPGDRLVEWLIPGIDTHAPTFLHMFYGPKQVEEEIQQAGLIGTAILDGLWELRVPAGGGASRSAGSL